MAQSQTLIFLTSICIPQYFSNKNLRICEKKKSHTINKQTNKKNPTRFSLLFSAVLSNSRLYE